MKKGAVYYLLLLLAVIFTRYTLAANLSVTDEQLPNILSLGISGDSEQGRDRYVDIDVSATPKLRLVATVGKSNTQSSDPVIPGTQTNTYAGGMFYHLNDDLNIGIDIGHWGQANSLFIDTLQASVEIQRPTVSILLTPQKREFKFYTQLRKIDFTSQGLGANVSYFGVPGVMLSASYATYRYSVDVTKLRPLINPDTLAEYIIVGRILPSTYAAVLNLAGGLASHKVTLGFSHQFEHAEMGFEEILIKSAIDGLKVNATTIYISKQFSRSWSATIQFGNQRVKIRNDVRFASLSIGYTF